MSASLIAKLQLDIAGYQAALAKSSGDLEAYKQRSIKQVDAIGAAQKRLNESAGARGVIDGRLQLRLLEARIAGNDKEVRQLEQRQQLLMQMRQIQRDTGVSQREAYSLSQRLGPGGSMGGGRRGFAAGNAAMQVQDIAVQLQMGTQKSIILAQQGSQLLSVFGAGGAIAGGVLAIGGAFHTMRVNAVNAFNATMKASKELAAENALLIQSTNADNLSSHLGKVGKDLKDIDEQLKNLEHGDSQLSHLWLWLRSGGNPHEMQQQLLQKRAEAGDTKGAMVDRALVSSKQQVQIAQLVAEGRQDEADALERSIKLSEELRRIDAMPIQDWAKDRLKKDAAAKSDAEAQAATLKQTKKIEDAQKKLDEARNKAAEEQLDLSEKIEKLKQEIAAPSGADTKDPVAKMEEEAKRIGLQSELNQLLKEQESLTHQAAEDARKNAEEEKRRLEAQKKQTAELKKQQAQRNVSRENLMMDLEVMRLRAAGRTKAADKMQRERDIAEDAARIRKETGASPEQALESAKERARLQDRINRRESGQAGHIYGVQGEGKRMGSAGGGGLEEFKRMQKKGYSNLLSDRGERSIPGHYMGGGDGGSLADRAKRANGAQDSAEKGGDTGMDLVGKILSMLTRLTTTVAG